MRDTRTWQTPLAAKIKAHHQSTDDQPAPRRQLQIELGLYLLETVAPGQSPQGLSYVLDGYRTLWQTLPTTDPAARARLANARHVLGGVGGRYQWDTELRSYTLLPEHVRGYALDLPSRTFKRLACSVAAERWDAFEQTLSRPLPFATKPIQDATPGRDYLFRAGRTTRGLSLPLWLPTPDRAPAHDLTVRPRAPIKVSWAELRQTAAIMDELDATAGRNNKWTGRIDGSTLQIRHGDNTFGNCDELTIDRMLHLVGMVSAGKSTLVFVLAVWAARNGLRVTLVVGDNTSSLRTVEQLGRYGVVAAPVMGHSNRQRHVNRLHTLYRPPVGGMILASTSIFDQVSTACALDALSHEAQPLDLRHAPCGSLIPREKVSDERLPAGRRFACPLWHGCQRHQPSRDLVDAAVWVATPWSLVHTRVPNQLNDESVRYLEAAWRRSDLIVVDEADQVQANLDAMFATGQTLLGPGQDAWLDEIGARFDAQLRALGRGPIRLANVRDFNLALNAVRAAAGIAYHLLQLDRHRARGVLRPWIDRDYFTGLTLFQQLAQDWAGFAPGSARRRDKGWDTDPCYLELRRIFDAFVDAPSGSTGDPVGDELAALAASVSSDDEAVRPQRVRDWLDGFLGRGLAPGLRVTPADVAASATRLEFALMVAIIGSRLNQMLRLWPTVAADLDLSDLPIAELGQPPLDLLPVVLESPMGNVLGFQYVESDSRTADGQMGEVRFFRYSGAGRTLLTDLPDLFPADGDGPNVLLLSGTSWAGTSPRYHVDVQVGGILQPSPEDLAGVARTTAQFRPLVANETPIRVSGKWGPERVAALRQMVTVLAKPGPAGRSLLEKERDALPAGRQRIMLLVGSYREAKQVAEALVQQRPAWRDDVRYLVPDDDFDADWDGPQRIRRADVATLAGTGAWILVTPMLAIERGHNILNDDGVAAIGAAFFLVRPHPRPDDLTYVTQRINQYAQGQISRGPTPMVNPGADALEETGKERRRAAQRRWRVLLHSRVAYSQLDAAERRSLAWTQLVTIWQVIGRLVRGGQPAKVYFCDAAFAPRTAQHIDGVSDIAGTSLLLGLREVLEPYFDPNGADPDRYLVQALYQPLWQALSQMGDL